MAQYNTPTPIPMAAQSKVWICDHSLVGIAGSNPIKGMDLVSVDCCQAEVSATGRSLFQRSPTVCGVFECDRKASIIRRPWPTKGLLGKWKNLAGDVAINVTLMTNTLDKPLSNVAVVSTRYYRCTLLEGPCKPHERHEFEELVTVSKFEITPLHIRMTSERSIG
jgi:hypothetical protein